MGQDTPVIRPAAATVAHSPSTTRSPACSRSRVVIRAPAGTAGIDSVNDLRPHHGARQYQRRLRHTSSIRVRPCGRSRGRVHTYSFTRVEITPHVGQAAAVSSAVATSTSSVSAALRSTSVTASPSRLNSSVASPAPAPAPVGPSAEGTATTTGRGSPDPDGARRTPAADGSVR